MHDTATRIADRDSDSRDLASGLKLGKHADRDPHISDSNAQSRREDVDSEKVRDGRKLGKDPGWDSDRKP